MPLSSSLSIVTLTCAVLRRVRSHAAPGGAAYSGRDAGASPSAGGAPPCGVTSTSSAPSCASTTSTSEYGIALPIGLATQQSAPASKPAFSASDVCRERPESPDFRGDGVIRLFVDCEIRSSSERRLPPEGVEGRFASGVASDGRFASSAGMPSPSLLARLDRTDVDTRISSSDAVRSVVGGGSSAILCTRSVFAA